MATPQSANADSSPKRGAKAISFPHCPPQRQTAPAAFCSGSCSACQKKSCEDFFDKLHPPSILILSKCCFAPKVVDVSRLLDGGLLYLRRALPPQAPPLLSYPRPAAHVLRQTEKRRKFPALLVFNSASPQFVAVFVCADALKLLEGAGEMRGIGVTHHLADIPDAQLRIGQKLLRRLYADGVKDVVKALPGVLIQLL